MCSNNARVVTMHVQYTYTYVRTIAHQCADGRGGRVELRHFEFLADLCVCVCVCVCVCEDVVIHKHTHTEREREREREGERETCQRRGVEGWVGRIYVRILTNVYIYVYLHSYIYTHTYIRIYIRILTYVYI